MNIRCNFYRNSTQTVFFSNTAETVVFGGGFGCSIQTQTSVAAGANTFMVRNSGADSLYYTYCDYQGNLLAVTNAAGTIKERYAYDPWGRRLNPANWSEKDTRTSFLFSRGYTMHEHLDDFELINMNGRMYDPLVAQFLSPDPYVQAPGNWYNYNRYAYCMNNPLIYTDPDGEWIHLLVGAFIGGTMNFIMNVHKIENIGQGLAYFGVGAAAGALGAGVGAGISSAKAGGSFGAGFIGSSAAMTATSSFITGAAIGGGAGLAGGFTTGFGNGLLGGQSFGESLWSGTKSGLIGGLSGAALGGLLGGIDAARDGRRFWDGATVQKTVLVEQPIPAVPQRGDMNCVPANVEAIDRSFGGDITQKEMRDILGGEADNDMLLDGNIWDAYRDYRAPQYYIHQSDMTGNARLGEVLNNMQAGQRVSINTTVNGGHSVVMQKVVQQTVTKINGTVSQKLLYYVMNPNGGVFQRISAGTIENAHNIFYIFPR